MAYSSLSVVVGVGSGFTFAILTGSGSSVI
jgi:hypothetical protein